MADNCGKLSDGNWGFIILDSTFVDVQSFPQRKYLFWKPDLSGPVSSNTSWILLSFLPKTLIDLPSEILTQPTWPCLPLLPPLLSTQLRHGHLSHHT